MPGPLFPARLAFAADGTPRSGVYDDPYHSAEGGAAQAEHVFLRGTGLPQRWQGKERFTVLELGFGFGLAFLATWQAWRDDPQRCDRLYFASLEKHPFTAQDLAVLHAAYPALAPLAEELRSNWPVLVPGFHRIAFESGRVVLTIALGDVADTLPQFTLAADAIYLDGFAPAKNPAMWSQPVMRQLARLAAPGATAATWSVAAVVREGLRDAGFVAEKRRGFARKSEMLVASLAPRRVEREAAARMERRALVIGAGVAGAAACERLAARDWTVTLLERHPVTAAEASGNHAGAFHPVLTPDDSLFARLTRAAYLYALRQWNVLEDLSWHRCGLLQLARDGDEAVAQRRALEALAPPPGFAQLFDAAQARKVAGVSLSTGGLWFPESGWIQPRSLVNALLAACGERLRPRLQREVASLSRDGGMWIAKDARGTVLGEAPVVILANAADALRLTPQPSIPLRRVRGQLSLVPGIADLRTVVLRGGMALPAVEGRSAVGASYDIDDEDPMPRLDSHAGNLERLEHMLPGAGAGLDPAQLEGRVAFRATVRDRLPLVGPLEDARGPGLYGAFAYGSRGLIWSGIAAELIASRLEDEPLPLERKLVASLDPARFALRAARRGTGAALPGATSAPA
ncbi:MAG: bifunctional tRNA (5-methylaminomethyl-2-thiouridine)(34)-methyltransferase MnmD/FAD-dependent 5-carboxymethylaminomethyl-2-thiouridine(34) oxidoreductase MnmC [Betaproteobacteria bacterium]|nr:bifunctional tRNA (5-methylaminomethyl-2-thiouridine)(34)-methyltransferase MnmD/FAD-dependent 5-carboxymethylaminomethyl-2-thiouridine(34) oxidoreductase MnmC [Betaproteobacteria bacterium]